MQTTGTADATDAADATDSGFESGSSSGGFECFSQPPVEEPVPPNVIVVLGPESKGAAQIVEELLATWGREDVRFSVLVPTGVQLPPPIGGCTGSCDTCPGTTRLVSPYDPALGWAEALADDTRFSCILDPEHPTEVWLIEPGEEELTGVLTAELEGSFVHLSCDTCDLESRGDNLAAQSSRTLGQTSSLSREDITTLGAFVSAPRLACSWATDVGPLDEVSVENTSILARSLFRIAYPVKSSGDCTGLPETPTLENIPMQFAATFGVEGMSVEACSPMCRVLQSEPAASTSVLEWRCF